MKLYTEEQVDIMLSRARMQKQDDTYMFTNEYLLSQETPIEVPSDEEIEKKIKLILSARFVDFKIRKDGIEYVFEGDFIKNIIYKSEYYKQILNQNKQK